MHKQDLHCKSEKQSVTFIATCFITICCLFPIVFTIITSFARNEHFSMSQYMFLFQLNSSFWRFLKNSLIITLPTVALHILITVPAAYGYARIKTRLAEFFFFLYMVTLLMPRVVTLIPNYIAADKLNLLGSFWAVIFPVVFTTMGVLLLRQTICMIPQNIFEAAESEGAGQLAILWDIVIPLSLKSITLLAVLAFIEQWNAIELPLVLLQNADKYPLSLLLDSGVVTIKKSLYAYSSMMMAIPVLMLWVIGRRGFEAMEVS